MLLSGLTALVLSIVHPSTFLFAIGIFTIYLIGTGTRHIALKLKGDASTSPTWMDWTLTLLMLGFGLVLVGYGVYKIVHSNYFGIVLIVFGLVGLSGVRQDFKYYQGLEKDRLYWLRTHIARMTGGYIAATTAFLVNNTQHLQNIPGYIYWLLPTIILTPLIIKWQRQYISKKA
jgi:hypothetical protein